MFQIVLGSEGADSVKVVGGHSEAQQYGHLHSTEHSKEAPSEIHKRSLEGGVDRFHHLSPSHGDPPSGCPEGNSLVKSKFRRPYRDNSLTTLICVHLHQW